MKNTRILKSFAGIAAALLLVSGCGSNASTGTTAAPTTSEPKTTQEAAADTEAQTEKETEAQSAAQDFGKIIVGVDGGYPPFCFLNDNDELDGFEISIMKEIAERNGLDIECQVTSWDSMFGQLDSERIDTVAEAITVTEARLETYTFSKTYMEDSNRFLVRAGEEDSISTYEDLAGKRIGVASGQMAYDQLEQLKAEYNIDFEIVPYSTTTNPLDVSLGRLDATYMNPIAGLTTSKEADLNLAVAKVEAYNADFCAYPFLQNERGEALAKIFSDTLEEMANDGTLSALSEEWLGADITDVH